MKTIFTPTEAAAFAYLPPKRVYKELEYKIIQPVSDVPRLSFAALIYLRVLKEINFEFSVNFRMNLYQRLVKAIENHASNLEIAKFFTLQLDGITQELSDLITQFYKWKAQLVTDPNIMAGETVFPNSRLSVRRIGGMLERGESPLTIKEDYPYLSSADLQFSPLYVKAYPVAGRPKKSMKFLIDEDLSPAVARYLCQELLIDAVAVRDRGLLGKDARTILEYAFNQDRILITANIRDFERFGRMVEVHGGIVFIEEGDLLRSEQIEVLKEVVKAIEGEIETGKDMVNRVLYISINGTKHFESLP